MEEPVVAARYRNGVDPLYKRVTYAREGRFILGAIEFPEKTDTVALLETLRANLISSPR